MVGANDLEASRKFYDAVLGTLKIAPGVSNKNTRYFYRSPTGTFSITQPINGQAATHANGGTLGFLAESPEQEIKSALFTAPRNQLDKRNLPRYVIALVVNKLRARLDGQIF